MAARQNGMAASTLINAAEKAFGDEDALAIELISLASMSLVTVVKTISNKR
ncbi:hypothetical protein [Psychrobacter sp. JCM 18901]|uniref:hypothetical protein n=1 Tax=Psychrobacter sp. JCM 18901 TaxID=1298609 RepID=UPI0021C2FE1E|nr:hypothetical protein [Psychrobacter sp. JCM 18901]